MRSLLLLCGVLLALWVPPTLQQPVQWMLLAAMPLLLWRPALRTGLLFVIGFLYAQLVADGVRQGAVTADRQLILARIASIPAGGADGWQFDAEIRFPRQPQLATQRARLTMPDIAPLPAPGESWQFAVQFSAPATMQQARGLLRDHITSVARVLKGPLNRRESSASWNLDQWRAKVAAHIDARVADPSAAALLAALAVGVTGDVSLQQWRVFNATGITHLVAISGMHVTFFAMLSMALARRVWRHMPSLAKHLRREAFTAGTGVLMALGYALLSGFSVPAQRTVVMLAAFLLLREFARTSRPAWSVAAALVVVLLYDPLSALSAGFWLSFGAVAAIVLLAGARLQIAAQLRAALHVQGLVTLALLPATVAIFGSFPAFGVVANAVAIPTFTFLLVPPVLVATAGYLLPGTAAHWCADQLVDLAAAVASLLWPILTWCAEVPYALWHATAPLSWYFLAFPALLLALLPVTRALRGVAVAALFSVFLLREPRPAHGELWLDMLDVGASHALLVRTHGHLLVYGSGEKFGSAGRSFDSRVLPELRRSAYPAMDLWLPGGLGKDVQAAILRAAALMPLRRVELPDGLPPPETGLCVERSWHWDGVEFHVAIASAAKGCVLRATVGRRTVEIAADNGRSSGASASGPSDILMLPRTASAAAQRNPGPGTLLLASVSRSEWQAESWLRLRRQWSGAGIAVLATATEGDVRLRIDADGKVARAQSAARLREVIASLGL